MISRKFEGKSNVVGPNIKKLRTELNLSRAALSNNLMMIGIDINPDSIYDIEVGERIVKDFELSALSKILKTTETDLLKDFRNKLG